MQSMAHRSNANSIASQRLAPRYPEDMGARTLVTFEQFEKFPDDGMKHELVKGEHIVV